MIPPLPLGFRASGVHSGVGARKTKPDLALFYSERPCKSAAVFTTNRVKAAPVLVSRTRAGGPVRAIVANSGCANACTGRRGLADALQMCRLAARALSSPSGALKESQVLVASTGVIGQYLPMNKISRGIQRLASTLKSGGESRNGLGPLSAVQGIMTTDTVPKTAGKAVRLNGRPFTLWGCAKGSGMIHPDMATMLSFILTDAALPSSAMKRMLKDAAGRTFNSLSVDGDTSTNDCVFLLANGMSGCALSDKAELKAFEDALNEVCSSLARQMAADGEGATKMVEIFVKGARSGEDAKRIARTVANSALVKTAMFGEDANWGRIIAAAGRSGARFDPERVEILFGRLPVARNGAALNFSEKAAKRILRGKTVPVTIDLHQGRGECRFLTCDFSLDYVKINADYRT